MSTAPGWERWNGHYKQQVAPVFEAMLRAIDARDGMTVLDLACGPGQPAIPTAQRVAPTGRVIATDLAADMLAACGRLARAEGVTNLELREMDMHVIGLPDASVDAVTCAFAVMFSPEPGRVLGEIHRVLAPGGRFAVAVWDAPAANPFFTTMFAAIGQLAPAPPPSPAAPGPFRLAAPGELAELARDAGFADVRVEPVPFTWRFDSVAQHYEMNRDMAAPLQKLATTRPPADVERLRAALATAIAPHVTADGRVAIPGTALVASGRRTS